MPPMSTIPIFHNQAIPWVLPLPPELWLMGLNFPCMVTSGLVSESLFHSMGRRYEAGNSSTNILLAPPLADLDTTAMSRFSFPPAQHQANHTNDHEEGSGDAERPWQWLLAK
ncbi:hypothetical protein MRB53_002606 [Persea americana]|uniref:Uncharacterized protein n=1 Tax=Persea americana TaxID=3435 RepID=A0ACC2MVC0_PERAE|nr:hypothetical protein MRB53_002606 [Persea americana]